MYRILCAHAVRKYADSANTLQVRHAQNKHITEKYAASANNTVLAGHKYYEVHSAMDGSLLLVLSVISFLFG